MRVWTILVAAGSGERFGGPKQFMSLGSERVIDLSYAAAESVSEKVVCVVPSGDEDQAPEGAIVVPGGETRSQSVRNGLSVVPDDVDIVIVHDGARPLASKTLFERVVEEVEAGAAGAIPGVPITNTIKRVEDSQVLATANRNEFVAVQTPQCFSLSVLRDAYSNDAEATDDAALVEAAGHSVVVVPGEELNVKITTELDLQTAEYWLNQKRVET